MAVLARVWQRREGAVFEARDEPLRAFHVEPLPEGGARLAFPMHEGRALLDVASADDLMAFAAAVMREATTERKRFFDGAFELRVETSGLPPARGKRMVSFVRDGQRILHAWCVEGILHTVWRPIELQQAMRLLTEELSRLPRPSSSGDAR